MHKPLRGTRRTHRLSRQPPHDPEFETLDLNEVQRRSDDGAVDHSSPELSSSPCGPPRTIPSGESQRPPHSRKKADDHIPRPRNSFIIFRSQHWQEIKDDPTTPRHHTAISCLAATRWLALSEEERTHYRQLAELEKEAFYLQYPDYKYHPAFRKDKRAKRNTSRKSSANKTLRAKKLASQPSQSVGMIERELRRDDVDSDPEYTPSWRCTPQPLRGSVQQKEIQRSRASLRVRHELSERSLPSAPTTPESEDVELPSTPDSDELLWGLGSEDECSSIPYSRDVEFPSTPDSDDLELPLYAKQADFGLTCIEDMAMMTLDDPDADFQMGSDAFSLAFATTYFQEAVCDGHNVNDHFVDTPTSHSQSHIEGLESHIRGLKSHIDGSKPHIDKPEFHIDGGDDHSDMVDYSPHGDAMDVN